MTDLTPAQLSAPRPWSLVDESKSEHPSVSIRSPGKESSVAFKYAPMPHEVADFAHAVNCVNALAGIKNPAAFVAAFEGMWEALERIDSAFGGEYGLERCTSQQIDAVHFSEAALQSARAARGEV